MDPADTVRAYYDAIDAGEYDRLRDLLTTGFVHERPDQTIEGHDRFVDFMRTERPKKETEHRVSQMYSGPDGAIAVEGRLLDADERLLFEFVDAFDLVDGEITRIRTFVA